jgi:hypothetical protein
MSTQDSLAETRKQLSQTVAKWQLTIDSFPLLFEELEKLGVEPRFNSNHEQIEVCFSGDSDRFNEVWRHLRTAGYRPEFRPVEGEMITSFSTYWKHPLTPRPAYSPIWMHFGSTVCRRVQTGTRMVKQPIYEIRCGGEDV